MDQPYRGGLWTALFLILLLPVLFVRTGISFPALSRPLWGLGGSVPRAQAVWEYYSETGQLPVWLGGKLTQPQPLVKDTSGVLVAINAEGKLLWSEEMLGPGRGISDGQQLILAAGKGRLSKFNSLQGALWSEKVDWETHALALFEEGQIAVAQGPVQEGQSNLLERVCIYDADGNFLTEHIFRNNSVISLATGADRAGVSTISLATSGSSGQLFSLGLDSTAAQLLWQNTEIIASMALGPEGIAAAAGDTIFLSTTEGKISAVQLDYPVRQLAWVPGKMLAAVEAGAKPAAGTLVLLKTDGKRCWQHDLNGECRSLVVRGDEILVAVANVVYCYSDRGDLNWCYQGPTTIKDLHPLAAEKKVVVTTTGNHLLLLEPPSVPTAS